MLGLVPGGGRIDKPILKAGNQYYKYKAKRHVWPRAKGVCMNPVEHLNGGGNQQHLGKIFLNYKDRESNTLIKTLVSIEKIHMNIVFLALS